MSDVSAILQNLDKRVGALESADIDDAATLTQIRKLYADLEIVITLRHRLHRYNVVGRNVENVAVMGVYQRHPTLICGPNTII